MGFYKKITAPDIWCGADSVADSPGFKPTTRSLPLLPNSYSQRSAPLSTVYTMILLPKTIVFSYLWGNSTKGQSFTCSALLCSALLCSAISVLHRESACQVLFHGVHLLLPNKAQKRLTASSMMLATGCHCGFCRFRPFWLCVPIFRWVCLSLRHCA